MVAYQYVGRTTDFLGKPLWEILGNLKDMGVGRLVIRHKFQRYPEPCFYKILKVAACPQPVYKIRPEFVNDLKDRRCIALVEEYWRGQKNEEIVQLMAETYKADYQLVPKDEEYKYYEGCKPRKMEILPRTLEMPPLLKELTKRNLKAKGMPVDNIPELPHAYEMNKLSIKKSRVAEEGEEPTVKITCGLGVPTHPQSLYANIKPI